MKNIVLFCVLVLGAIPAFSQQESLTITTYYPAPFGVYREMRMFKGAPLNQEILLNNDNGNPNIELRYLDRGVPPAGSGTPYIDLSNDPASDFDFRLILIGNNDVRLRGGNPGAIVSVTRTTAGGAEEYAPVRAGEVWICSGAVN